jgi:isoleucyl-tRNA synthetase
MRSRDRNDSDFFSTTHHALVTLCKLLAPFTPFLAEVIYVNLTKEESVHLALWPKLNKEEKPSDKKLIREMQIVREIVELGHCLRKENNIPVRQPLNNLKIKNNKLEINGLEKLILDELNIKSISWDEKTNKLDLLITPELKEEADTRDLIRKIQAARKELGVQIDDKVNLSSPWMPKTDNLKKWVIEKTLINKIVKGEFGISLEDEI